MTAESLHSRPSSSNLSTLNGNADRLVFSVRQLVASNLGWFHETRATIGEEAGRERAININSQVFERWFNADERQGKRVTISCRYPESRNGILGQAIIEEHDRPIALQGAGKNWRLAGDAIPGTFYGTLRVNDFLLMMFDRQSKKLNWLCVRGGISDSGRQIPNNELWVYENIRSLLGSPNAGASMWIPSPETTARILLLAESIYPKAGYLLMSLAFLGQEFQQALQGTGLVFSPALTTRMVAALLSKRFVILTGLSGSGKTKLAQSFTEWISESPDQVALVPVGADWTSNERVVGFPDALNSQSYVTSPILQLVIRANDTPDLPHFLILDEMNLSHVERYFSDFLSAMESGEAIPLHPGPDPRSSVPPSIRLPSNLFVIGTVNVDETTYMFSPKILDRAQVIEFRVSATELSTYLTNTPTISLGTLRNTGKGFGPLFVTAHERGAVPQGEALSTTADEIRLFFDVLKRFEREFGFRTAGEIVTFVGFHGLVYGDGWNPKDALDAAVMQKVLPRLNGSRRELEPVLRALETVCRAMHLAGEIPRAELLKQAVEASALSNPGPSPLTWADSGEQMLEDDMVQYPLSLDKIRRMTWRLMTAGFTSFAEA